MWSTCEYTLAVYWLLLRFCDEYTGIYCSILSVFCVYLKDHMIFTKIKRGGEKNRESRKRRNRREGGGKGEPGVRKRKTRREKKRMDKETGRRGGGGKRRQLGWRKGETGRKQRRWSQLPGITCQIPKRAKGHRHEHKTLPCSPCSQLHTSVSAEMWSFQLSPQGWECDSAPQVYREEHTEPACSAGGRKRRRCDPRVGKIPLKRAWQSTPLFLPGKSHGQRSWAGCSPWSHKELDMTEAT